MSRKKRLVKTARSGNEYWIEKEYRSLVMVRGGAQLLEARCEGREAS